MMTDFEEIKFDDSDEDIEDLPHDGFEDLVLPEEEEPNGTKKCRCSCHNNPRLINFYKRNKHCYSCCLKVINGELYYKINKQVIRRVKVTRHTAIKAKGNNPEPENDIPVPSQLVEQSQPIEQETIAWMDEDEAIAEKENVNVLPKIKSKQFGIKLKISSKKKGKQKRFYSLKEMTESPVKQEIPSCSMDGFSGNESTQHAPETALHTVTNSDANKILASQDKHSTPPGAGKDMLSACNNPCDSDGTASGASAGSENSNLQVNPELRTENVGETSPFVPPAEESASADILAKALQEAMISQNDVTLDGSLLCQPLMNSPEKLTAQISTVVQVRETTEKDVRMNEGSSAYSEVFKTNQSDIPNFTESDSIKDKHASTSEVPQSFVDDGLKQRNETSPSDSDKIVVSNSASSSSEKRRIVPIPVPEDKLCMSPAFMVPSNEDTSSIHSIKSPASSGPIITYTNSPMFHSDSSSENVIKSSNQSQKLPQKPVFSPPSQPISTAALRRRCPIDGKSNDGTSEERKVGKDESASKGAPSPCPSSNQSWCSERTIISSVIGFGSEASNTSTHSLEGRVSSDRGNGKVAEKNLKDSESAEVAWTRYYSSITKTFRHIYTCILKKISFLDFSILNI
ncbi:hypothetical protein FSP39_022725 [Pinctada imbricata]|uniref:Uncharacterized protein n=1 Tax=Pinctada imbricata TaxID=66713 RepID=A0AA88Y6B9_PINIB|nr:hypothetical protein FSP39_022725 [Pinctada imbricata]